MSGWQAVNVATITEEDVEQEEVGEDGTVATINNTTAPSTAVKENGIDPEDSTESNRGSVIERQDSLVEKLVEENAKGVGGASSSLLRAISFSADPLPTFSGPSVPTSTSTLPSRINSTRNSPSRTSPSRYSPTPPSPTSPKGNRRKSSERRGARGSGFTMTLSDKFVTELSVYDPQEYIPGEGGPQVCLGLFLGTDQVTGDHTVYKVSPVSPLATLKLKPQDRILKVNGLSVLGWSHSCVLEWVRNLSVVPSTRKNDAPYELVITLEYRRAGKTVRAPWEAPASRQVLAALVIAKKRASVKTIKEGETNIQYQHTQNCRLRPVDHPHQYLAACVVPGGGVALEVIDDQGNDTDQAHFLLHTFRVSPSLRIGGEGGGGGEVVVVEATSPSSFFLIPSSPTQLSFMHCPWSAVKGLTQADPRCLTLYTVAGGVRMEAVYTGNFLSVGSGGVVGMVARDAVDAALPTSTLFTLETA